MNVIEEKEDLWCSTGPVSSMPGSLHPFPEGACCDQHSDRLAVKRVQGETDSFKESEYNENKRYKQRM